MSEPFEIDAAPPDLPPAIHRPAQEGPVSGLLPPSEQGFQSSDVLVHKALSDLPPVFTTMFANRKIERPERITDLYSFPTNRGGSYRPADGRIRLGRGIEAATGDADAVNGTRHELLHAISNEHQAFSDDASQNFSGLAQIYMSSLPGMMAPHLGPVHESAMKRIQAGDGSHLFTDLADAAARGLPLPPRVAAYFAPMFHANPYVPSKGPR